MRSTQFFFKLQIRAERFNLVELAEGKKCCLLIMLHSA